MILIMSLLAYYLLLMACLRVLHLFAIRYHWGNTDFQLGAAIMGSIAYIGLNWVCGSILMRELFRQWLILYVLVAILAVFSYDYLLAWWTTWHDED